VGGWEKERDKGGKKRKSKMSDDDSVAHFFFPQQGRVMFCLQQHSLSMK
jgi:hypothetical protein